MWDALNRAERYRDLAEEVSPPRGDQLITPNEKPIFADGRIL